MTNELIVASGILAILSGIPAAVLPARFRAGQVASALVLVCANAVGLYAVAQWLMGGPDQALTFPSPIAGASVSVNMDGLSAFFLVPLLVVTATASAYGVEYWKSSEHLESFRRVPLFFGIMSGAMTLLVVAQDGLLFLAAWETMAVSALVLVAAEDHIVETRRAAWLYIAASHFATLCAFGVFALLRALTGSWEFSVIDDAQAPLAIVMAVLALLGFGTKAGIMPMHIWLPSAHSQAPSHVSAIMSGVMIKMGIYGIVRVCTFFPEIPLVWGGVVLALGTISAILGVAFAIGQHDIKRLLAYHSVENIGIIVMGLGLALIGRAMHEPAWVVLGIAGGMLHVWNHALFKSLLFLGAGSVIHSLDTRDMDVMGGLAKRMPWTANCFLVGAVAICGLPPLNGFVSEILVYSGLFRVLQDSPPEPVQAAGLAAPGLALVGALAAACFIKVFGVVFLGAPRSDPASAAHEAGRAMIGPMLVLVFCCAAIGLVPWAFVPILDAMTDSWAGGTMQLPSLAAEFSLVPISIMAAILIALCIAGWAGLRWRGVARAPRGLTWDCGYAAPSPRMQYTSSSFAEMLVKLFRWALHPVVHAPGIRELFPRHARFSSHVDDTVLEKILLPAVRGGLWLVRWGRYFQNGSLQAYLLYILAVIVFLFLWQ